MAKPHQKAHETETTDDFSLTPIPDKAAKVIEAIKTRVIKTLENSESKFRTIFEQSTFGNKIIDSDLRIIKVNCALTQLLGYSAEELQGTLITAIAHPEYVNDWKELQAKLWADKNASFSIDTCILMKDQATLWCRVTSIIFEDSGATFGYTIFEDITERKNMDRIRAEVDTKKDEFISIVSHELRTPLTTIKAINQLLEKAVSKDQTYYGFIEKSNYHILRLEKLILDLVDVTKIQAGNVDLNIINFDVNAFIKACIGSLQTIHPTHEIHFKGTLPVTIMGDQFRIEQVLINLINNAVKYSPSSNKIDVRLSSAAGYVKIAVQDYGIGIAKKNLSSIFKRFYRVGEAGHHFQGLGLGLYIASEIVSKHEGTFGIESKLGEGTTIWFSLPMVQHLD